MIVVLWDRINAPTLTHGRKKPNQVACCNRQPKSADSEFMTNRSNYELMTSGIVKHASAGRYAKRRSQQFTCRHECCGLWHAVCKRCKRKTSEQSTASGLFKGKWCHIRASRHKMLCRLSASIVMTEETLSRVVECAALQMRAPLTKPC